MSSRGLGLGFAGPPCARESSGQAPSLWGFRVLAPIRRPMLGVRRLDANHPHLLPVAGRYYDRTRGHLLRRGGDGRLFSTHYVNRGSKDSEDRKECYGT